MGGVPRVSCVPRRGPVESRVTEKCAGDTYAVPPRSTTSGEPRVNKKTPMFIVDVDRSKFRVRCALVVRSWEVVHTGETYKPHVEPRGALSLSFSARVLIMPAWTWLTTLRRARRSVGESHTSFRSTESRASVRSRTNPSSWRHFFPL